MVRAGAHALTILSVPLNVHVLTALEDGPMSLVNLRRAAGSPPQSTLRKQLSSMAELGILKRHRKPGIGGTVDYEIGVPGSELIKVAIIVNDWLQNSPYGPYEIGTQAAKSSIKALVDGWSSGIIRACAAKALALTDLDRLIVSLTYPTLERRVGAMRLAGQIVVCPGGGRTRPYAVTAWLRRAAAPLASAIEWERTFGGDHAPSPTTLDAESLFLLAVPLLQLAPELSGAARLVVQFRTKDGAPRPAGAMVGVQEGQIQSCVSSLEGKADGWASGSLWAWLTALAEGQRDGLELGGSRGLVGAIIDGLHETLGAHRVAAACGVMAHASH